MKALDLMTPRPRVVTPGEPLVRAAEIMRDYDVGAVPVVEDRESMRVVGIITDRDIAIRHVAAGYHYGCPVRQEMTAGPLAAVRPYDGVDEVMHLMKRHKVRRVLVTDEGGRLLGIIAQADLALCEGPGEPDRVEDVLERISEPDLLHV